MIRALVLDVDGVLTDGGVILDEGDGEAKRFHTHDGVGVKLAQIAGWRVLFLTARNSPPARRRAQELEADFALGVAEKAPFLENWLAEAGIDWSEVAYVGDDLQDLGALRRAGWPIAVANAVPEVREAARYVTRTPGGRGAVRDAVEWLLSEHGIREETVASFVSRRDGFAVGVTRGGKTGD